MMMTPTVIPGLLDVVCVADILSVVAKVSGKVSPKARAKVKEYLPLAKALAVRVDDVARARADDVLISLSEIVVVEISKVFVRAFLSNVNAEVSFAKLKPILFSMMMMMVPGYLKT